jgi:hypothetical protein
MQIQLKNQQTLMDVSLMHGGGLEKVFEIAHANNYPLDSILDTHTVTIPDFTASTEKELSDFLQYHNTTYTAHPDV